MLTFRQLEAFRAVIDAGSVVKASDIMGLSQPAVSRLLTNLEATVGYRLFNRRRGRLVPLDEARELYEEVERSFVGLARIAEAAERIAHKRARNLRFATLPGLMAGPMPGLVAQFLEDHPDVFLSLESRTRTQVLDGLAHGLHDIGLASLPISRPDVGTIRCPGSECVCLVPASHPLAGRSEISAQDLDGVDCIMGADRTPLRLKVGEAFAAAGARPIVRAEVTAARTAVALVAKGVGICLGWRYTEDDAVGDEVRIIPFRPQIVGELAIVYPIARPPEGIVAEFVDAYLAAAEAWRNGAG